MPRPTPFFKKIVAVRSGEYSHHLYALDIDGRVYSWTSALDDVNKNAHLQNVPPSTHMEWVPLMNPGEPERTISHGS